MIHLKLSSDLSRQYFVNADDTVAQRVNDLYWLFFLMNFCRLMALLKVYSFLIPILFLCIDCCCEG